MFTGPKAPVLIVCLFTLLLFSPPAQAQGWTELPNTKLMDVCPPDQHGYQFSFYCQFLLTAWRGGIADTTRNRLILWGGGHNDYYGNELYALNLGTTPQTLTRLNDPSPNNPFGSDTCPEALSDGNPNSRHTYNGLAYIEHIDRMFAVGGSLACGPGGGGGNTWTLDLSTLQWLHMDPVNGAKPPVNLGQNAAYDPNTKTVFLHLGETLLQYTYETNTYKLLSSNAGLPFLVSGVIDPQRKLFIFMGTEWASTDPRVLAIDIAPGSAYAVQDWSSQVSGCNPLAGVESPGLAYDSVQDRIVGWPNVGNTVFVFNPDTKRCISQSFPDGPQNSYGTGTFGRFRYFPALNAFVVINEWNLNAQLLQLSTRTDSTSPQGSSESPRSSQ